MFEEIRKKSKRLLLSTIVSLALLGNAVGCTFIDYGHVRRKEVGRSTEEVARDRVKKSEIRYSIKNDLKSNNLNLRVDETRKTTTEEEYDLVTRINYEKQAKEREKTWMDVLASTPKNQLKVIGYVSTGESSTDVSSESKSRRIDRQTTYGPAKNIKVEIISPKGTVNFKRFGRRQPQTILTDRNGEISLEMEGGVDNWALTNKDLYTKIQNHWSVKGIKEPLRSTLLPTIEALIEEQIEDITVSTCERSRHNRRVSNDMARVEIRGVSIEYEKILPLLKDYIDRNINSKIEETTVNIQDSNSHVEIPKVKLDMKVDAPTKRDLASAYFTGELLDFATLQIKPYQRGKFSTYTDKQGRVTFSVYVPSKLKFETKHPKYHAFEKSTTFSPKNLTKTIRLTDIGQKLRVEEVEEGKGKLIEE